MMFYYSSEFGVRVDALGHRVVVRWDGWMPFSVRNSLNAAVRYKAIVPGIGWAVIVSRTIP